MTGVGRHHGVEHARVGAGQLSDANDATGGGSSASAAVAALWASAWVTVVLS